MGPHQHHQHHALHLAPRLPPPAFGPDGHLLTGREIRSGVFERTPPPSGGGGGDSNAPSDSSGSDGSSDSSGTASSGSATTSTTSSATASSTCGPDDNSGSCEKNSSVPTTVPILCAILIPLALAIILFIYLHRRHVRRLRSEDANDKHKSLDFGLDPSAAHARKKSRLGRKSGPEMADTQTGMPPLRPTRGRGMSMDLGLGSPYLLPHGLQTSQESLHSLSRTAHSRDDRYRPATTFIPNEGSSLRSYPSNHTPRGPENSSNHSGSSGGMHDGMQSGLLRNASRMSQSLPPQPELAEPPRNNEIPTIQMPEPSHSISRKELPAAPASGSLLSPAATDAPRDSYVDDNASAMRNSNNYLGTMINLRASSLDADQPHPDDASSAATSPGASQPLLQATGARKSPPPAINTQAAEHVAGPMHSMEAPVIQLPEGDNFLDDASDYGDFSLTDPGVAARSSNALRDASPEVPLEVVHEDSRGMLDAPLPGQDVRRLSMGMRPLPPDDPSDDPEVRANRIRSFYKEYFDDSKPGPVAAHDDYYEDYGQEYLGDAPMFDPDSGQFIMPGAEPYGRRAMTPPPRAPPRFRGGPHHQFSSSNVMPSGPRAFSSASARMGPGGPGRRAKPLPPPMPLRVLPTPHMLKEDSFALPIDFAPPSTVRDRQAGRPESPRGGMMPYSPTLPAHLPLASSFDDLAAMPSPHALRRSGTFTGLDFAPPPRFKNETGGSDAGSIRSNRSNASAQQLYNIRSGAYRLSRVPKETVGTKMDLAVSLRPQWDLSK